MQAGDATRSASPPPPVKYVDAPPPKENAWSKRKTETDTSKTPATSEAPSASVAAAPAEAGAPKKEAVSVAAPAAQPAAAPPVRRVGYVTCDNG